MKIKIKLATFFFCGFLTYSSTGCKSLNDVVYDCPTDFRNEITPISDTITVNHPLIITVHEGKKRHDLLIPYSLLKSVHANSKFYSILKSGGMLIAYHNIESYNYKLHSTINDSALIVKNVIKIGKNDIKEFEHPITKFLSLRVSKGCYNKLERFIDWIPLRGKNSNVNIIFPLE